MDVIDLSVFSSRLAAVCDEMGAVLQRSSFSPNIRDRLDYSCAVFDPQGDLCAQAAHIPVHLGSMAWAMRGIVSDIDWQPGDMVILNDPYLGGTHLPDVTLIAPVFSQHELAGFVVNRAHHADIGAESPGSMPISTSLDEEGMVIAPTKLVRNERVDESVLSTLVDSTRNPVESRGDFIAQVSANHTGLRRMQELLSDMAPADWLTALQSLNAYAERLAASSLNDIPDGVYRYADVLDDDGQENHDLRIAVAMKVDGHRIHIDFAGTAGQAAGNVNCPLSVAAAAVYYVFRCLMPEQTPACTGSFRGISISAPEACLLNAVRPAAVAAGNVETSTRIVDVIMGALAQAIDDMPAASHGSMNNLAMGSRKGGEQWDYYETIGGGMGAGPHYDGLSAVQTHMTNTLNTPIEALEMRFPVRVLRYAVRRGSGGAGRHRGGDGIIREYGLLADTHVTILSERRRHRPWGLAGGREGMSGENLLNGRALPGKCEFLAREGDRVTIETPGGGGWGLQQTSNDQPGG
jgi:N-methylhydantoinase B